jgi:hypothetical protein
MLEGDTIARNSAAGHCHPILDTAWPEPTVASGARQCDAVARLAGSATRGCNSLLLVEGLHHFHIKCSTYHDISSHMLPSYCFANRLVDDNTGLRTV